MFNSRLWTQSSKRLALQQHHVSLTKSRHDFGSSPLLTAQLRANPSTTFHSLTRMTRAVENPRFPRSSRTRPNFGMALCRLSTTTRRLTPIRIRKRMNAFSKQVSPSTSLKTTSSKTTTTSSSSLWTRIAHSVRFIRIPFLLVSIYGLGFQQGVVETVRNPLKLQQGTFETLCVDMGAALDDIDIISERRSSSTNTTRNTEHGWFFNSDRDAKEHKPETQRIARIARDIISAARGHVHLELDKAISNARDTYNTTEMDRQELIQVIQEDFDVDFWLKARQRLEGEAMDGIENWQYILVGTDIPNAFVTEVLPQRLFVTTALFDHFVETDDELAMILGHEISHLILGHLSEKNGVQYALRGIEIVCLAFDPTEGALSLAVASFLAAAREALLAAHSRSNETEADELGCKIAAMACYDTVKGSRVFQRMHEYESKESGSKKSIMSTHPPSEDRYKYLLQMSKEDKENYTKYSYCNRLKDRLQRALGIASARGESTQ